MAQERTRDVQERDREGSGEQRGVARRENPAQGVAMRVPSPFTLMRRFIDDLDRLFDSDLGPSLAPRIDVGAGEGRGSTWVPAVEVLEREGEVVIRADIPGVDKEHLNVEVQDGQLVISGERRQEREERREGFYRSERFYGVFQRAIPLPEGADPSQARATFRDGVLEITMPRRPSGRRIEIQEGPASGEGRQRDAKSA
jgi:HSP20 family protein